MRRFGFVPCDRRARGGGHTESLAPFRDGGGEVLSDFERALAFVFRQEGGFSNDPHDPGNYVDGRFVGTKYGISAKSYPKLDIANLTMDEAKEIYRRDYWSKSGANKLQWPLSLAVFDLAVNSGVGAAQRILTLSGHDFASFNQRRREWYRSLKQFNRYGAAWLSRVDAVEREGKP